jgi:hypothetical protein
VNNGGWQGRRRSRRKKKGRRADLWWLLSLAEMLEATDSGTGDGAGGSRWSAVALFFPFLSLLCFSFFSLLLLLLFSALSLLFSSFRSSPLSFFFAPPPHFYRQKQGRDVAGAATVLPPQKLPEEHISSLFSNTWKASGKWGWCQRLFEERDGGDRGRKKIFFFPCFARPREEEDPQCL